MKSHHESIVRGELVAALALLSMTCLSGQRGDPCGVNTFCDQDHYCDVGNPEKPRCVPPGKQVDVCGNGIEESYDEKTEVCDDENNDSGDGCSADCLSQEICGNSIVDFAQDEECDCGDGDVDPMSPDCRGQKNSNTGGYCRADCRRHCGDGEVAPQEACDTARVVTTKSCVELGFNRGRPGCGSACDDFSTATCHTWDWQPMTSPTRADLHDVWGSNPDNVIAVGDEGTVLRYNGQQWSPETSLPPGVDAEALRGVSGSGADDIFVVGREGVILHHDGDGWTRRDCVGSREHLNAVWSSGPGSALAVSDAGAIWNIRVSPSGVQCTKDHDLPGRFLEDIWGNGPDDVFAVARSGEVFRRDNGAWTAMTGVPTGAKYAVMGAPDSDSDVFIAGEHTVFRYRRSSGQWLPSHGNQLAFLQDLWISRADHIFTVGHYNDDGVARYFDGLDWYRTTPATIALLAVWGGPTDEIFAVGEDGVIVHHDGHPKTLHDSPVRNRSISAVWVDGEGRAVVVGEGGSVARRIPESSGNWESLDTGSTTPALLSITGHDGDLVATGSLSSILRCDCDGQNPSWSKYVHPGPNISLRGVWASPSGTFLVVGDEGTVLMSTDGGLQWSQVAHDKTQEDLWAVWGIDDDNVFAVGDRGTVLRRRDGHWSVETGLTTSRLRGVWASSADHVFVVAENGEVLHHDGADWQTSLQVNAELYTIWGSSPDDVYVAGENGALFHHDGELGPREDGNPWLPIDAETTADFLSVAGDLSGRHIFLLGRERATDRIYQLTSPP